MYANEPAWLGLLARLDPVVAITTREPVTIAQPRRYDFTTLYGHFHATACDANQIALKAQILKQLLLGEYRVIMIHFGVNHPL